MLLFENPKKLLQELKQYRRKQPPFEDSQVFQFDGDIVAFWGFAATKVKELGKVACRIYSIWGAPQQNKA